MELELNEITKEQLEEILEEITSEMNDKKFELMCYVKVKEALEKMIIDYEAGNLKISIDVDLIKDINLSRYIFNSIRKHVAEYLGRDVFNEKEKNI